MFHQNCQFKQTLWIIITMVKPQHISMFIVMCYPFKIYPTWQELFSHVENFLVPLASLSPMYLYFLLPLKCLYHLMSKYTSHPYQNSILLLYFFFFFFFLLGHWGSFLVHEVHPQCTENADYLIQYIYRRMSQYSQSIYWHSQSQYCSTLSQNSLV